MQDFSNITWDRVFERQRQREGLVGDWLDGLGLKPGDRVLDIGAGPGFVSLQAAARVGEHGLVYAVDTSGEALAFLERLQGEQGVPQIRRITADAATLEPLGDAIGAALVTMMLHHVHDPAAVLRHVVELLTDDGRIVVAEFHPDGPCDVGPPRERRIAPEKVEAWGGLVGLRPIRFTRQSPEHYMFVLQKSPHLGRGQAAAPASGSSVTP